MALNKKDDDTEKENIPKDWHWLHGCFGLGVGAFFWFLFYGPDNGNVVKNYVAQRYWHKHVNPWEKWISLWADKAHGIIAHFRDMNIVSNVLLVAFLFIIVQMLVQVTWSALSVFHALAIGDKDVLFNHCVDYLLKENLGMSYVDVNVFYFCILGPLIFLLLTFLIITGLHRFSWHWLAVFHEPHSWRYWLNAIILFAMLPCCHYALYVLKHDVLSR